MIPPDHDPLVKIDRRRISDEVQKRTPFLMREFEQLLGWFFSCGEAPTSKRVLAWEVLQLKPANQKLLQDIQQRFPKAFVTAVRPIATDREKK